MGTTSVAREEQALARLRERLVTTFAKTWSPDDVDSAISRARQRFDGRVVRDFVPILVERIVRQELSAGPADRS